MLALASALNAGPRVQALLETRGALSSPGLVGPAQGGQAPGHAIQRHAPLRPPGFRAASPVVQRVADWFDLFVEAALEAFSPRFVDLVGAFLMAANTARGIAAEEDEGEELELADEVIGLFCGHVMEEGWLGGVIEALATLRHRLPTLDGIPDAAVKSLADTIDRQMAAFRTVIQRQLEDAKAYVEASKSEFQEDDDANVQGAAESLLRPSSQAHYLDPKSTGPVAPISHGQQDKASVYHRSLKHPLYKGMKRNKGAVLAAMTAKQQYPPAKLKSGGAAHLGLYPNAMTFERNKIAPRGPKDKLEEPKETSGGTGELYDRSLEYRLDLCRRVASRAGNVRYLRVLVANDYPLVMVRFDLKAFMADYPPGNAAIGSSTTKAFTSFLMNYFLGIVNFLAHNAGLNITMVERSSFGFLTPSIAETAESFRINTGLTPPVYADVLARALGRLSAELQDLAEKGAPLPGLPVNADDPYLDDRQPSARKPKPADSDAEEEEEEEAVEPKGPAVPKRERYRGITDAMHLAAFPIEKTGKSAIANAARNRASLDFVNASAFNTMANKQEFALGNTLVKLLGGMEIEKKKTLTTHAPPATYAKIVPMGSSLRAPEEARARFEELLAFLRQRLLTLAKEAEAISGSDELVEQLLNVVPLIYGDSPHLAIALELVNELILVHSIRSAQNRGKLEDGYGSGSDVEEDEDEERTARPLRATKIITHNGMRALLASLSAENELTFVPSGKGGTMAIRVGSAYYEVSDALKLSGVGTPVSTNRAHVLITDINACVTGGTVPEPAKDLTSGQYAVWVIDTTSATQAQSAVVVRAFKESRAQLLYLISSGFKQEQFGADRNQYGTIRVFADKGPEGHDKLKAIIGRVRASEMPLGAIANIYRRVMKSLGAVPRNENLLARSSTAKPLKPETASARPVDESTLDALFSDPAFLEDMAREHALETFVASLRSAPTAMEEEEEEDEDASRHASDKASGEHASAYIHAQGSDGMRSGASRDWFAVQPNPGGGDCLLHALMGETLEFRQIVEMRSAMAHALPEGGAHGGFSGSMAYQTLYQSGFMNEGLHDELQGRHQLTHEVMQNLVRIPGAYAGDLEVQAYCRWKNAHVLVVTHAGELRRIGPDGIQAVLNVGTDGADALLSRVGEALNGGQIVLYQSLNHWERITGVKNKG